MIWMGVQLFFGFVIGALLLWACVAGISALLRSLAGLRAGFREGFDEGFQQSLQKRFPSTARGSSYSYAGPKGPPELWGKRIDSSPLPPRTEAAESDRTVQGGERQTAGRILAVNDEEVVRDTISSMLTSAGYQCRAVAGGLEALALLESGENFELLLTDLINAPLDGLSLLERTKERFPNVAVIVASAVHDDDLVRACMRSGASDYLFMPFDREQLLSTVGRALEHQRSLLQNAEKEAKDEPGGEAWWRHRARVYQVQVRRGDHWMSVWRGFSHDQAVRICQRGQQQGREVRIVQEPWTVSQDVGA